MSTTTTKYGFIKPERSDNYSVDVMGNNMDKIEAALNNVKSSSITNSGNLTNSGTITSTGQIVANGGVKGGAISGTTGTFDGTVTATKFTPTSTTTINVTSGTPTTNGTGYDANNHVLIFVLPDVPKTQYTGSVKVTNCDQYSTSIYYNTKWGNNLTKVSLDANATGTISFTNVPHVYIYAGTRILRLGNITFS